AQGPAVHRRRAQPEHRADARPGRLDGVRGERPRRRRRRVGPGRGHRGGHPARPPAVAGPARRLAQRVPPLRGRPEGRMTAANSHPCQLKYLTGPRSLASREWQRPEEDVMTAAQDAQDQFVEFGLRGQRAVADSVKVWTETARDYTARFTEATTSPRTRQLVDGGYELAEQ